MNEKLLRVRLYVTFFLLLLLLLNIVIGRFGGICPRELRGAQLGAPSIISRTSDRLNTGIRQILADENRLYVLYGNYGVVQVYNLSGAYLYSISFYNDSHGRAEIAVQNDTFYYRDKSGNVYAFREDRFVEFMERGTAKSLDLAFDMGTEGYELRGSSVWHVPEAGEPMCVLRRAPWLVVYQNNMTFWISIVLVLSIFALVSLPMTRHP